MSLASNGCRFYTIMISNYRLKTVEWLEEILDPKERRTSYGDSVLIFWPETCAGQFLENELLPESARGLILLRGGNDGGVGLGQDHRLGEMCVEGEHNREEKRSCQCCQQNPLRLYWPTSFLLDTDTGVHAHRLVLFVKEGLRKQWILRRTCRRGQLPPGSPPSICNVGLRDLGASAIPSSAQELNCVWLCGLWSCEQVNCSRMSRWSTCCHSLLLR